MLLLLIGSLVDQSKNKWSRSQETECPIFETVGLDHQGCDEPGADEASGSAALRGAWWA